METFAYAFMFDAEHESLGHEFGPPCTRRVVDALKNNGDAVLATQVHKGSLLPHLEAYRIAHVSSSKTANASTLQVNQTPDHGLYAIAVCELADSLCEQPNTLDSETFLLALAQKEIWTIVLPTITPAQAFSIDTELRRFHPYLGMAQIDLGNPLQFRQFSLVDGMYFANGNLHYCTDHFVDDSDRNEARAIALMYSNDPIETPPNVFEKSMPTGLVMAPISQRGRLSLDRLAARRRLDYRQRVAAELITKFENGEIDDFSLQVEDVGERQFICEEAKVRDYLLNVDHPKGGSKARFFIETLGIARSDWRYLADQIERAMHDATLLRVAQTPFGITHRSFVKIRGRNDRDAVLQTGWELKELGAARLITAYPGDVDEETKPAPRATIIDPKLTGDERWNAVYLTAHSFGVEAARSCVPVPMVLQNYRPVFEGMCGFAWVHLSDARTKFCRWLAGRSIGYKRYPSGYCVPSNLSGSDLLFGDTQSIEPKIAYCEAFAAVLEANGISCGTDSRLD